MISRRPIVIANEIRLKRSQYRGVFLVVEGRDDRLFIQRFTDPDACKVEVAEGKSNVLEVIRILDGDGFKGAIGQVDSDFDLLEGRSFVSSNIVSTDYHDLECMLLESRAFQAVLVEYGSANKIRNLGRDVRDAVFSAAYRIGCLRLFSERSRLALRFEGLDYSRCVDSRTLELDTHAMIIEVGNRSQKFDLDATALQREIELIEREGHSRSDLCSGEDVLGILAFALRKTIGTNSSTAVRRDDLVRALRLAYCDEDFQPTKLRRSLLDWEKQNGPFHLLQAPPS